MCGVGVGVGVGGGRSSLARSVRRFFYVPCVMRPILLSCELRRRGAVEKNTYRHSSPVNVNRNPYKSVLRVCWASLLGTKNNHFELPSMENLLPPVGSSQGHKSSSNII